MAGIKVTSSKRNSFPCLSFESEIEEDGQAEGEGLQQYLNRLTDGNFRQILHNEHLLNGFSNLLIERFGHIERLEDALENLWRILERMNNLDYILSLIGRAETARQNLLDSLHRSEEEIRKTYKITNIGRLIGSVVDIGGTAGGLLMQESSPTYANWAFRTATSFGLLGIASTFSEMDALNNTLGDLMEKIKHDQEVIAPIQSWYQQNEELNLAVQAVFPFDESSRMIEVFTDVSNAAVNPVRILASLIRSVGERDITNLRDEGRIKNLIYISSHEDSQDLLRWIWYRRHPIILDVAKILLQLQSSDRWRFALSQFIPALSIAEQNITSFPVWARFGLNLLSIHDTVKSLMGIRIPPILHEMKHLRHHFKSELIALQRIAKFIAQRRRARRASTS